MTPISNQTTSLPLGYFPDILLEKIIGIVDGPLVMRSVSSRFHKVVDLIHRNFRDYIPNIQAEMESRNFAYDAKSLSIVDLFKFFRCLVREICANEEGKAFLEELKKKKSSRHDNKSLLLKTADTFSLHIKRALTYELSIIDFSSYINELEQTAKSFQSLFSYENLKQMLEWKRKKDFKTFCKGLGIPELNAQFVENNDVDRGLSESVRKARDWIQESPNILLEISLLKILYMRIRTLPPEIGQLMNLQILDLRYNQLTTLPPEIGQLTDLQVFDLRENKLRSLPPEIGRLTALQALCVGNNQLNSLPPEIGQLMNLQSLDLSYNQLTTLPPEIDRIPNLFVRGNPFLSLPSVSFRNTQFWIRHILGPRFSFLMDRNIREVLAQNGGPLWLLNVDYVNQLELLNDLIKGLYLLLPPSKRRSVVMISSVLFPLIFSYFFYLFIFLKKEK